VPEAEAGVDGAAGRSVSPYIPALDGLRAVAVGAVLLFHQGWAWASGGFLGVSVFFTVSGFIIGSLLYKATRAGGSLDLFGFWSRRIRRLVPAGVTVIALTWAAAQLVDFGATSELRGHAIAALLYVENFHLIRSGSDYGALFSRPSPFIHYWSLAIEEQFYVFIGVAFRVLGGRSRVLTGFLVLALVLGVGRNLWLGAAGNGTSLYYDPLSRAPEILGGVLLAGAIGARALDRSPFLRRPYLIDVAAGCALVVLGVLFVTSSPSSPALRSGLLPATAVLSAALVTAAVHPGTVAGALLSRRPLPFVGRLSYALYLVHWPVYLVVDEVLPAADLAVLIGTKLVVTTGLAVLLHALVERPVRYRVRRSATALKIAVPATAAVLLLVAVVPTLPTRAPDFAAVAADLASGTEGAAPDGLMLRAAMFGDSTAALTGSGLAAWGAATGALEMVGASVLFGCGAARKGDRDYHGEVGPVPAECDWAVSWRGEVEARQVQLAIVQVGPWDVADRRLEGDSKWRAPGDPIYDTYLVSELGQAMDMFSSLGVKVVWLTSPLVDLGRSEVPRRAYSASEPARMRRYNELLRSAAASRPHVRLVDLAALLAGEPGGELDARLRPDGVHFTKVTSREIADRLGPLIVAAHTDQRPAPRATVTR